MKIINLRAIGHILSYEIVHAKIKPNTYIQYTNITLICLNIVEVIRKEYKQWKYRVYYSKKILKAD